MFQLLIICSLSFILSAHSAVRTNSNEVTDFYDKNLESKSDFFDNYHGENNRAVESIKAGSNHEMLEGYKERDSKAAYLSDIRAVELEGQGRHARNSAEYSFYDENELEPNWSKAGNKMHKEDADELASATARLFTDLMDKLRDLGLADCKTVKGDKVKEPIYMIDIKREEQRNTEYDQFFCEEPRNRYGCTDTLKLRCSRRGIKYGAAETRTITFAGADLFYLANDIGKTHKWDGSIQEWYVWRTSDSLQKQTMRIEKMRSVIATQLGVSRDSIVGDVVFPINRNVRARVTNKEWHLRSCEGRKKSTVVHRGTEYVMCASYEFTYTFRTSEEICARWSEDWTETCRLR